MIALRLSERIDDRVALLIVYGGVVRGEARRADEVDVINVFSTDGRLKEANLLVLEDDKNFFPSYYCATLIRKETLEKYPELEDVLAMLDDQISDEEMTYLNYLVEIENKDAKVVAKDFLVEKGLIK